MNKFQIINNATTIINDEFFKWINQIYVQEKEILVNTYSFDHYTLRRIINSVPGFNYSSVYIYFVVIDIKE